MRLYSAIKYRLNESMVLSMNRHMVVGCIIALVGATIAIIAIWRNRQDCLESNILAQRIADAGGFVAYDYQWQPGESSMREGIACPEPRIAKWLFGDNCFSDVLLVHISDVDGFRIRDLKRWHFLRKVSLMGARFDDRDLSHLAECAYLQELCLSGCSVGNLGAGHIAKMKALVLLDLSLTDISDPGLEKLAGLPHLSYLDLAGTNITSDGVGALKTYPSLEVLLLDGTRVDDSCLNALQKIRSLRRISLYGTEVSFGAVDEFRQLRPLVRVDFG